MQYERKAIFQNLNNTYNGIVIIISVFHLGFFTIECSAIFQKGLSKETERHIYIVHILKIK